MSTFKTYLEEAKMDKPRAGKAYGSTDQAAPEKYTPEQLSRLTDAMYNAQEAGIDYQAVFKLAPDDMKLEWNYSKWKYVA